MYPDDFTTSEAAYAPVSEGLFVGVSPLLALLCLMVLAGVAVLAWHLGRGSASDRGDDAAPAEIHKAILAASSAAMAASSNDLKGRAQTLRDRIHDLLGPVLDVAKGTAPGVRALDEALKGEKKPESKPAHGPATVASGHGCACGNPAACTCKPPSTAAPVTVNQIYIGATPAAPAGCDCQGAHKPDCRHATSHPPGPTPERKSEAVAMSGPEQVEALARAVRQFHDHWLDGPARIRELKAARAALSRLPPASRTRSHGHGH